MIELTDPAARRVRELQVEAGAADKLLRISVEPGGCSGLEYGMGFDQPKDGDQRLESHGVPFLVDATALEYMDGSTIHFDDSLQGKGFEIRNPKATSTCGCGKSFS